MVEATLHVVILKYLLLLSTDSKSCSSLGEKNSYSSTKWKSLSEEEKRAYNEMAKSFNQENRYINVEKEVSRLLTRLQKLVSQRV